jgi:hypothetical protein
MDITSWLSFIFSTLAISNLMASSFALALRGLELLQKWHGTHHYLFFQAPSFAAAKISARLPDRGNYLSALCFAGPVFFPGESQ